jgi:hypothetical protein
MTILIRAGHGTKNILKSAVRKTMALNRDGIKSLMVDIYCYGVRPEYGCPKCGKRFSVKTSGLYHLMKHIEKHHPVKDKPPRFADAK